MDKPLIAASVLLGATISSCLFFAFDMGTMKPAEEYRATAISRSYAPASTSTSTGMIYNSNGTVSPVTTTSSQSEEFTVIVRTTEGNVLSVSASPEAWAKCTTETPATIRQMRGGITNLPYSLHLGAVDNL